MERIALLCLVLFTAACGGPPSGEAQVGDNVARAALVAGSPDIALNVSNATLTRRPRDTAALLSQGDALSLLGRYAEAETSYTRVLAMEPRSIEANIGLGRLSLRTDAAHAETLFLTALREDPSNKVALNNLGIAYDLQGDHLRAQAAYRRALGADPTMRAAEVNLALSMALNGHAADAVRILKSIASGPGAPRRTRQNLAAALAIAGDQRAAEQILAADMDPAQIQHTLSVYQEFRQ